MKSPEKLALLTSLLGASLMLPKEEDKAEDQHGTEAGVTQYSFKYGEMKSLLEIIAGGRRDIIFSCPALSLHHNARVNERGKSDCDDDVVKESTNRKRVAEDHAVSRLARPLQLDSNVNAECEDHHFLRVIPSSEDEMGKSSIEQVP
jgi:hypothetical protein